MRIAAAALAFAVAACGTQEKPPAGAPELGVEFSWTGVDKCSDVSPRIVVRDFPAATKRFRVELVDLDAAISRHGGGEVEARPGGVIEAGALKSYRGPCPSQQAVKYEMRVVALDANGRVIARGSEQQTFTLTTLRRPSQGPRR